MKKLEIKLKTKYRKNFAILIFLLGLIIFLYPFISNTLTYKNQTKVINSYIKDMSSINETEIKAKEEISDKYNKELESAIVEESGVSYMDFLNLGEVLGYIEIPKIKVNLPIYHGISDDILRIGVGHLEKTSLPSENETVHAVYTGHRGLPTSTLFTNLDKLKVGDEFSIIYLSKKYNYTIDQIKIVLPKEVEELSLVEGKNYTTLITCTPYMINTHRLLLRAELVGTEIMDYKLPITNDKDDNQNVDCIYIEDDNENNTKTKYKDMILLMLCFGVFAFSLTTLYFIFFKTKVVVKKENNVEESELENNKNNDTKDKK